MKPQTDEPRGPHGYIGDHVMNDAAGLRALPPIYREEIAELRAEVIRLRWVLALQDPDTRESALPTGCKMLIFPPGWVVLPRGSRAHHLEPRRAAFLQDEGRWAVWDDGRTDPRRFVFLHDCIKSQMKDATPPEGWTPCP